MFVRYVTVLINNTIKKMKCVLYEKIQPELVYAIAKKEESRRERRSSVNAACCSISRALPCLVMCCKCTKPCDIKSFHVFKKEWYYGYEIWRTDFTHKNKNMGQLSQ